MIRKLLLPLLCLFLFAAPAARAVVYYVNAAQPNNNGDGLSWGAAKKDLQEAINIAPAGSELWVRSGTYLPTKDPGGNINAAAPRNRAFYIVSADIKLYGGFNGTETLLSQRNVVTNITTLSGDLDGPGGTADAYHVLVTADRSNTCLVDGFTITGGRADGSGTPVMFNFNGNVNTGASYYNYHGSGVYNINSSVSVNGCSINNNIATHNGGGMYNTDDRIPASSSPSVSNCTFNNNLGGGIYNALNSTSVSSCTFTSNSGGAIFAISDDRVLTTLTVTNCMFSNNATGNFLGGGTSGIQGGGVTFTNGHMNMSGCTFTNNSSGAGPGGAISGIGNGRGVNIVSVSNCNFTGNTSNNNGGAIGFSQHLSATVTNCNFTNDTAKAGNGGAASVDGSNSTGAPDLVLINCTFKGNKGFKGGAIYSREANLTVSGCSIHSNTGVEEGGGIHCNYGAMALTNSTVSNNSSGMNGGGLYTDTRYPFIGNCTFSANVSAQLGGGIYMWSSATIQNCILSGNTGGPAYHQDLYAYPISSPNPVISYSLIGDYNASAGNQYTSGPGIIAGDPLFINAASPAGADGIFRTADDGLRITCASPSRDAGTGTTPATDILGNSRVGIIDMGAYESPGTGCANIQYVDGSMPANGNGYSWVSAKRDLQEAINAVGIGGEVWVKAGTYLPTLDPNGNATPTDARDKTFYLTTKDVKLYGGFAGTETLLSQRNAVTNLTTLSGDLDGSGGTADAYHVMITTNRTAACIVDGFTITGGRGNGSGTVSYSGTSFDRSRAGGLYNSNSSPTIVGCIIRNNSAGTAGGGMYNATANPVITNCIFSTNTAGTNGGGMLNEGSSPVMTSTTISANAAIQNGGGINSDATSGGSITNSILSGNTGATVNQQNIYKIAGSGALTISYSVISDYSSTATNNYMASNILTGDPFVDVVSPAGADGIFRTADDGLRIGCSSVARDAGTGSTPATDILGNARVGTIDIGAYEFQGTSCPALMYVNSARPDNSGTGTSWATAKKDIQAAINEVAAGGEVWVQSGTYLPTRDGNGNAAPTDARDKTFYLLTKDVKLYGGFAGTETLLSQRNVNTNLTTLSGDLDGSSGTADAYHVLITSARTTACVVDGFTITGGRANGNSSAGFVGISFERGRAGGMYNLDGGLTVSNCNFTGNLAGNCGGMFNVNCTGPISNCTFNGNTSGLYGGAMYNAYSVPAISNCTFTANTANASGGGVYNLGGSASISNCTFSTNTASANGGGICNDGGNPTLSNTVFNNNTATQNGGGMYNITANPVLSNCVFSANTAGINGGGMLNNNSSPVITSATFSANIATQNGGAMYNTNASPVTTSSTLSNNTANQNGGGIYSDAGSGGNIVNSILSGNTGTTINRQNIYKITGSGTLTVSYTLISDYINAPTNNYTASNILTGDPMFVDATSPAGADGIFRTADDGLRTGCSSPTRDAGTGTTPTTDILGNGRVGTIDIGAYEYQGTSCPTQLYVNGSRPDNSGAGTSWASAKRDIQTAINEVAASGSVWVRSGTYLPTRDPNGNATPADAREKTFYLNTKDVKIYGGFAGTETLLSQRNATNVTILSGDLDGSGGTNDAYHVLITGNRAAACIVDGFTITGGRANGSGTVSYSGNAFDRSKAGGIFNNTSNPTISNCIISNNSSSSIAGGMYNINASPILTACTFGNNSAALGSGMYNATANPIITGCTFSNNTASQNGGGMLNENSSPAITNCTFNTNMATAGGGGIYNVNSNFPLSGCIFNANTASNNGGGILNLNSDPTITSCIFSVNTATQNGGAMYNATASPVIASSTFSNNTATQNGGGFYGDATSGGSITNSILSGNTGATVNQQNIYKIAGAGMLTVSYTLIGDYSSTAINNYTASNMLTGDPLFVNASSPAGADGIFRTADDGLRISCGSPARDAGTGTTPATDILGNSRVGSIDLGAYEIMASGCPALVYVDRSRPDNNGTGTSWTTAKRDVQAGINEVASGGSVWVKAGTYLPTLDPNGIDNTANARDKTFYINTKDVKLYGGFVGTETLLTQRNVTTNLTTLSGDLDSSSGTADAYHVLITANRTTACIVDGFTITGGRANGSGSVSYSGNSLDRSRAGGVYNNNSSPTINNCRISSNRSGSIAGGMYNVAASPVVTACTFSNNVATSGGGMYNATASPTITGCTFSNDTASQNGGGMLNESSSPVITSTTFNANPSSGSGGGLYNLNSSPSISGSTFTTNRAIINGGALYIEGGNPTLSNCTFTSDTANQNGGAVYILNSDPSISSSTFRTNIASMSGGGIYNNGGDPTVTNCAFASNTAIQNGGGVYNIAASPVITSCVFARNTAGGNGGGIMNENSSIAIRSCTFGANTATISGGGIRFDNTSGGTIVNTILNANTGGPLNRENIYKDAGTGTLTVSNSLVRDYSSTATNNYTATTILTGDPLFVAPNGPAGNDGVYRTADDGWRITSCASPAHDAGAGATPATDILGNPRVALIDIGAYENQSAGCLKNLFVNSNRPDNTGNGFSWATAKKDLQDAINAAGSGDTIFVQAGTYLPTIAPTGSATPRDKTFYISTRDVMLYGGFEGTETQVSQRDAATNLTILNGDLDGTAGTADAFHVLLIDGRTAACIIDGFTITGGRANSMSNATFGTRSFPRNYGGGICNVGSNNRISNCVISGNSSMTSAGGLYVSSGSPVISNCTLSSNMATSGTGGGFGTTSSSPVFINCDFKGNTASQVGGGIYTANSTVSATNCTFTNNTASNGGGISNGGGSGSNIVLLSNCIFSGNVANTGGGVYCFASSGGSSVSISSCTFSANRANSTSGGGGGIYTTQNSVITIRNSILSGNIGHLVNQQNIYKASAAGTIDVSYTLIGDYSSTATNNYTAGSGILTGDPLFIDAANPAGVDSIFRTADDGLALSGCSPAVNTGTTPSPALVQDILGNYRLGVYDLGAYEYQSAPTAQDVASTTTTATRTLNNGGVASFGDCSAVIAMLRSTGNKPLSGAVVAKVYVQGTAPVQGQTPYVRRYYDITPAIGADTSTAKITLYFTQADFDDYNAARGSRPPLPLDTVDAAGNKINVRVTQHHGSSATGLPGSFTGWAGAGPSIMLITPDSVKWDAVASRWQVIFPVTGFSGFFLHSGSAVPLPVTLLAFDAKYINISLNQVSWVTAHEETGTQFTVERNGDAKTFKSIGVVTGRGIFTGSEYRFQDRAPLEGNNYYRLKNRKPNGEESYSRTVLVRNAGTQAAGVVVFPNPSYDWVTIRCTQQGLLGSRAVLVDINGRVMQELMLDKETLLDIHAWPAGVYALRLADGNTIRIVKN